MIRRLKNLNGLMARLFALTQALSHLLPKERFIGVTDGVLTDDNGSRYHSFKNVIEINGRMNPQFIEVIE